MGRATSSMQRGLAIPPAIARHCVNANVNVNVNVKSIAAGKRYATHKTRT